MTSNILVCGIGMYLGHKQRGRPSDFPEAAMLGVIGH